MRLFRLARCELPRVHMHVHSHPLSMRKCSPPPRRRNSDRCQGLQLAHAYSFDDRNSFVGRLLAVTRLSDALTLNSTHSAFHKTNFKFSQKNLWITTKLRRRAQSTRGCKTAVVVLYLK